MNVNMERTSFTSLLDAQFCGGLQVQQQTLLQTQATPTFSMQGMMPQLHAVGPPQCMKQQSAQQVPVLAPGSHELPTDQAIPNILQSMFNRKDNSRLNPSSAETSLMSLVDGNLRVSSIANLPIFLKILPRCKTEPEQTLGLVVLRATSTANDAKLSNACARAFEKNGGLSLARAWVESSVSWQHNDLLILLLEVLQTLSLQLTSITEARINEPIVKLRKNASDERVKRAAQDLLKHWRSKFTEKERVSMSLSTAPSGKKAQENLRKSLSPTAAAKSSPSTNQGSAKLVPSKQSKVLKKRSIKRLERLPFGGGSVSKSSDLIGSLIQCKSAKDAAIAAATQKPENTGSLDESSDAKLDQDKEFSTSKQSTTTSVGEDPLSMPLPTIQSFKLASTSTVSSKERKKIRWADDNGAELVKVKLIESWRDLVPLDPRHDDHSFMDAKIREHANERNALLAQHRRVPPAVAASLSREWTTPAVISLPQALAARVNVITATDEMRVQDSRRRHQDEYEVLAGEVPISSPKEWERLDEPHRGPPVEIPLSDAVETEPSVLPIPKSTPLMAPPASVASSFGREVYSSGRYSQAQSYDFIDRVEFNGRQTSDAERKLREALGPLQENTVLLLLNNPDVVPQVLEEAQRHGNRVPDARVFEIVEHYRRGRFQAPPSAGATQAFSPFHSQLHLQYGVGMSTGVGFDRQYQQYPPQQGPPGHFLPGKRKADAMSLSQNGVISDALQSFKRPIKKRGTQPCRFFALPMGCKHGSNCHYAHNQTAAGNGPALNGIYNNNNNGTLGMGGRPMIGVRGPGLIDRFSAGYNHHMRGGR
ncbi:putative Zinc finger, CCCH-type, transcription factor IIS, TFIIS/LEDGF domain superfamily [Plasmopara halstedii]